MRQFSVSAILLGGLLFGPAGFAQQPQENAPLPPIYNPRTPETPSAARRRPNDQPSLPGVLHCPGGDDRCDWRWGEAPQEPRDADLALEDHKVGGLRCDLSLYLAADAALSSKDLARIERRLRFDTLKRLEQMLEDHPKDFSYAALECMTLEALAEQRWHEEREEKLVEKARRAQQDRRN